APDLAALDRTVGHLGDLTPLDGCADAAALTAAAPPPESPSKRAAAEALTREIDAIRGSLQAGRLQGLLPQAQAGGPARPPPPPRRPPNRRRSAPPPRR